MLLPEQAQETMQMTMTAQAEHFSDLLRNFNGTGGSRTGDSTHVLEWIAAFAAALLAMISMALIRRRRRQ